LSYMSDGYRKEVGISPMDNLLIWLFGAGWIALVVVAGSTNLLPVGAAWLAVLTYFGVTVVLLALTT
jgi:hypothetical protein